MPEFEITLERMAVMIRTVKVSAPTEDEAKEQAVEEDGSGDSYDYGFVDFDDGPPKVIECQKKSD